MSVSRTRNLALPPWVCCVLCVVQLKLATVPPEILLACHSNSKKLKFKNTDIIILLLLLLQNNWLFMQSRKYVFSLTQSSH